MIFSRIFVGFVIAYSNFTFCSLGDNKMVLKLIECLDFFLNCIKFKI